MSKAHNNAEDVRMRLNRNIGFYKGIPYYIRADTSVENWYQIRLYRLGKGVNGDGIVVDHRSEDLDMAHPPLGYINTNKNAFYATRSPYRRQAEGLRSDMIHFLKDTPNNYFATVEMERMLMNVYPTLNDCIKSVLEDGWKAKAFSKDLAFGWMDEMKVALLFKTRVIATYDSSSDSFTLLKSPESSYLRKFLLKNGEVLNGKTLN